MGKWCLISSRRHKGSLLLEVLLGFVVVSIAIMVFSARATQLFSSWQRMERDTELFDAGRYMLTKLERELSISSTSVSILNGNKLNITTEWGERKLEIFLQPVFSGAVEDGLYMRTITNDGSGVNPVFIRDCFVDNWRVERISDKEIFVSFDLYKDQRRKTFARIFYCVNGEVRDAS